MKTYGLLGENISYSMSPVMHNAALKHYGIPGEYVIFDVTEESLEDFLRENILSGKVSGFNVTVPHKIRMRELLEKCALLKVTEGDEWVSLTGALNTVKIEADAASVYNTDVVGFGKSVAEDLGYDVQASGNDIFLFGAGGAGRGVILGGDRASWECVSRCAARADSVDAILHICHNAPLPQIRQCEVRHE